MTDITPVFNDALRAHNAPPVSSHRYSVDRLDEFLKEAYSIVWFGYHSLYNIGLTKEHRMPA